LSTPKAVLLRTSLLAAMEAKLRWLRPPVPRMNSRMPFGVATPDGS